MSSLYLPYLLADYYHILEIMTVIVGVLIMLSSLDDLFIDGWYWARQAYRSLMVKRRYKALTAEQLRSKREQPLAIMIPAWLEYDVIAPMLENMVGSLEYKNYYIFVGTYCNDARTIEEVERMRRRYKQLIRVEVPHDGPTCKADCLNWIIQAIFAQDLRQPEPFAGVVLHDSEDVLHHLELHYFNYLLPRIDFIQLPVTSLERDWYELVAGTYMDEFAEWHTKDLVVRESMSKMVPSAGVGTCFSRKALLQLSAETNNQPFNTATLTEDYDIGARLARRGMKQIFGKFPVDYIAKRAKWFGQGEANMVAIHMPLGVREYFPDTFRTAYRQKARWTLGIGLQGWSQVGWEGSLATKYLLFRDRKGLVTSFVAIVAYILLAQHLLFMVMTSMDWWTTYYPSVFSPHSGLMQLMWANGILLSLRVLQRGYFVGRLYGWEHALLSAPRMIIGNFINAMAAARAWRLYLGHLFLGKPLVWDKTMHDFPSADQLVQQRLRLGDLLMSWRAIDQESLNKALQAQAAEHKPLGQILLEHGYLDQATLSEAISFQNDTGQPTAASPTEQRSSETP